jgi:hypothetical protein
MSRNCAEPYFHRYFRYGIPPGDIGDLEVGALLDVAGRGEAAELDGRLAQMAEKGGMLRLVPKLRRLEETVEPAAARQLALAICRQGALVPRERAMMIPDWTFSQGAILVMRLASRIPAGAERERLARQAVETAEPLPFAFECVKWFRKGDETPETERVVSAECEEELGRPVAARIRLKAQETPLYKTFGADAPRLLWLWNKYGEPGEVGQYLKQQMERDASEVDVLLGTFVGRAWGLESGLSHKADFERDNYNAIEKLVDPEFIVAKLKAKYGSDLGTPEYRLGDNGPYELRLAHQFVYIHQHVKQETQSGDSAEEDKKQ